MKINQSISMFNLSEHNLDLAYEIYHAIIEYIKSGNAISDMGHPDFLDGAKNKSKNQYSSYSPDLTIYRLAKTFSDFLSNYDTALIWYRDLSTWEKFCKFIIEIHQNEVLKKKGRLVKSINYYLNNQICPACGIQKFNYINNKKDKISLTRDKNLIFVKCRRCGKFIITSGSFKYLDTFAKKSKLFVFLHTRTNKECNDLINPQKLREIIK